MKVALVGNQNAGKTTLFNSLTGMNQVVGNWPGVTIERKEGTIKGTDITIVDLPGIYSMSPYTSEEEVSRNFVLEEKPDLIINIIDSTSLERSLYLTTQLLELNCNVIIAMNMIDIMEAKGVKIDVAKLSAELNTTIVSISALKKLGIDELISKIKNNDIIVNTHQKIYSPDVEQALKFIADYHKDHKLSRFELVKVFERDIAFQVLDDDNIRRYISEVEAKEGMDSEQIIANQRYNYIGKVRQAAVKATKPAVSMTDRIDRIVLNKWLAIPIFVVIMALVYLFSVGFVGGLTSDLIDGFFNGMTSFTIFGNTIPLKFIGLGPWMAQKILYAGGSAWAASLVESGIVTGVGAVLTFVPQLLALFFSLALLETTGYMSRISFFFDRIFKKIGLSGKSLIPFIVGAGCSVSGIMSARTIETEQEKKMTIILTPFVPCSAKLPLIALFSSAFFGDSAWLVTLSLYLFSIVMIILGALILKKIFHTPEATTYISELPDYHAPSARYVGRIVGDRTGDFIKRAGSIIFICSLIIWFLASFTYRMDYVDGVNYFIKDSLLANIGNGLAWFFYPMLGGHWSWEASVSAIQGLIAKEQVISSMNVIAGLSDLSANATSIFDTAAFSFFTPITAYAYVTFNLFSIPCVSAVSAMRSELHSRKDFIIAIVFEVVVAWVLSSFIGFIGWAVL
ncbi:MAG: ferrous iron transport protein B [Bacilli bacterium]|nr:ferrous iron transport protein B [Bacilli bacterium]